MSNIVGFVQKATGGAYATSAQSATFTGATPVQGNAIVAWVQNVTNGTALTSVKDGNGNSFQLIISQPRTTGSMLYLYLLVAGASQSKTATATLSGASLAIDIFEYSNIPNASTYSDMFEAMSSLSSTATTSSSAIPAISTYNPGDMFMGGVGATSTMGTITQPTFWTVGYNTPSTLSTFGNAYVQSNAQGYSMNFSWTTSKAFEAIQAVLSPKLAVVQRTFASNASGATTVATALPNNKATSNAIVVIVFQQYSTSFGTMTVSDSLGNTYVPIINGSNITDAVGYSVWIAYGGTGGADTITVTNSVSIVMNLHVLELSGVATSSAIDVAVSQFQAAVTSVTSGSGVTANTNDILIAAAGGRNTGTFVAGTGYGHLNTNAGFLDSYTEDQVVAATGTYAGTFTSGTTFTGVSLLLAISDTVIPHKQSFSAGISSTGAFTKTPSRMLPASLAFAGNFIRSVAHSLTASLTFSGLLTYIHNTSGTMYTQSLNAGLSFVGVMSKTTSYPLTATLNFVGSMSRLISRSFTPSLTFVGSLIKSPSRLLPGVLTFTGLIIKLPGKIFTAGLTLSGSLLKQLEKGLIATLGFTGVLSRSVFRTLSGSLSFSGLLSAFHQHFTTLTASLSFSGNISKLIKFPLTASLSFTGTILRVIKRSLTASLSFVGSLPKSTARTFTAALTFVGSIATVKSSGTLNLKSLAAGLSFVGNINKTTLIPLSASLVFAGNIVKGMSRKLTGASTFVGTFVTNHQHLKTLTGSLSFTGAFVKTPLKYLSASLTFVGVITRITEHVLTAILQPTGNLFKTINRKLTGSLSFIGTFTKSHINGVSFTGGLSFIGVFKKSDNKSVNANLTFTGMIMKKMYAVFSSNLSFAGTLIKKYINPLFVNIKAVVSTGLKTVTESTSNKVTNVASGVKLDNVSTSVKTDTVASTSKNTNISSGNKTVNL
jgi:hypothetical protein